MTDLVETNFKEPRKRSPQAQRRIDWQKDYEAAQVIVADRSRGWCEVDGCDRPADTFHHKKGRRAVDANDPAMILHVDNVCHTRIHQFPELSRRLGYMVSRTS